MAGEIRIGGKSKLYIDAAGVGEGTWALVNRVGDVALNSSRRTVEVNERAEDETAVLVSKKTRTLTLNLTRRPGNAQYEAIRTAFETGQFIGVAVMESGIDVVGTKGYQADMNVTEFNDDQAIDGAVVPVTLMRAAESDTPPAMVTVVDD